MASPTVFAFSKLTGTGSIYNFEQAFRLVHKIAPVWEQLRVSSVTKNERELKFINRVTPSKNIQEVFNVFAGDYELVPKTYAKASGNTFGFISNPAKFNTLSADRKLQVSNYLLNNREQFNKHLALSCKLITDTVEKEFAKGTNIDGFLPKELSKIGYKSCDSHFSTIAELIKQSYKDIATAPINAKVNWVARTYIPIMNKLMYETISEHGMSTASHIFNSFKNNGFNIMGGSLNDVTTPGSFKEIYENKPTLKFERIFIGGESNVIKTDHNTMTSKQYLAQMVAGQEEFNKKYEEIYRELTKCLNDIQLTNVYKTQMNKLYPICKLFKDIAIKDPRTTVYISGFYGKKNRNSVYREIVHQAVVNLKEANISSFASALSIVEKLEKLVIDSANKARDLRLKFISSTKASSDELLMTVKMIKKPCHLTIKDFNNFDEALNRLYFQLKTSSSESDFLNSKEEFKNYLSKLSNRRDLIKDQFKLIEEEITHKALEIDDASLRSVYIEMKKRLNTERMNLCIYFSDVVDKYFTDLKIQNTGKPLTKKQVEDIEELVVAFRRARTSSRFTKKLDKLSEAYQLNADVFTIMRLMSDIIEESGYIPFIHGLFKALGLFTSGFDWERFEKNITMHLILNSFDVDVRYMGIPEVESVWDDDDDMDEYEKTSPQTVSRFIRNLARCMDQELINLTIKYNAGRKPGKIYPLCSIYNHLIDSLERYFKVNQTLPSLDELVLDMVNNDKLGEVKEYLSRAPINMNFTEDGEVNYRCIDNVENNSQIVTSSLDDGTPYWNKYGHEWLENASREMKNIDTKYLGVVINGSMNTAYKNAKIISESVFDSMFMQAINMVDNYWSLKYSGSLPLPMNTELLLKGGALIDTKAFHDISRATVIPEAVPFYIVAINAIYYYVHEVANKAKTSSGYVQTTKFSPLSTLYPITEIFGSKYQATVQTLSMAQLTTIISILNDIWNTTNGQLHEKLSTSIDMVLNELNASIMITDELQRQLLESNFQITNTFSKSIINNLDDAFQMISEVFKSSVENSFNFNDPESEQVAFEKFLNKAYKKILSVPSESRMSELKNLLQVDGKELDSSETDLLKFMDLGLGPFVICLQSYANIFKLFDFFIIELQNNAVVEIDLRDEKFIPYDVTEQIPDPVTMWDYMNTNPDITNIYLNMVYNPIVLKYNGVLLNKMWEKFAKTKKLEVPQFWAPTKRSTWPTEPKISCSYARTYQYPQFTRLLRQIYPTIKAKTFDDYFINALQEFRSDVDHTLHAFMSYPGMNDRTIRIVEHALHDNLEISKILDNDVIKKIRALFQATPIYKEKTPVSPVYIENEDPGYYIDDKNGEILEKIIRTSGVPNEMTLVWNSLPNVREIQSLQSGETVVPGIALVRRLNPVNERGEIIVQRTADGKLEGRKYNMKLLNYDYPVDDWNNYDLYVKEDYFQLRSLSGENPPININYGQEGTEAVDTWTDWVIYNLAECNSPDFVIPHRIVQRFQASPILRDIIKPLIVTSRKYQIDYTLNKVGKYVCNPITQNIMCRSLTEENKSRIDYSYFSPTCINSFIAKIPWMLNTLIAERDSIEGNVIYFDIIRQVEEFTELIRILKDVYSDISPRLTPLEFLQSTSSDKEHVLGELMVMARSTLDEIQIVKMEWANKFKFGYMTDVHFPDFKNKDSLAWLKEFADDIFRAPIFSSNFKVIYECLAHQVWNSLIANSNRIDFTPIMPNIDKREAKRIFMILRSSMMNGQYKKNDIQAELNAWIKQLELDPESGPEFAKRYRPFSDEIVFAPLKGGFNEIFLISDEKDKDKINLHFKNPVTDGPKEKLSRPKIDLTPDSTPNDIPGQAIKNSVLIPRLSDDELERLLGLTNENEISEPSRTTGLEGVPNRTSSKQSNLSISETDKASRHKKTSNKPQSISSTPNVSPIQSSDQSASSQRASTSQGRPSIEKSITPETNTIEPGSIIQTPDATQIPLYTASTLSNPLLPQLMSKPVSNSSTSWEEEEEKTPDSFGDEEIFSTDDEKGEETINNENNYDYYLHINKSDFEDKENVVIWYKDKNYYYAPIDNLKDANKCNEIYDDIVNVSGTEDEVKAITTTPQKTLKIPKRLLDNKGLVFYNPDETLKEAILDLEYETTIKTLDDRMKQDEDFQYNKEYQYDKLDDNLFTNLIDHIKEKLGNLIYSDDINNPIEPIEPQGNYGPWYNFLIKTINETNDLSLTSLLGFVQVLCEKIRYKNLHLLTPNEMGNLYNEILRNHSSEIYNSSTILDMTNPSVEAYRAVMVRMYQAVYNIVMSSFTFMNIYTSALHALRLSIDNNQNGTINEVKKSYRDYFDIFKPLYNFVAENMNKGNNTNQIPIYNEKGEPTKEFVENLFGGLFSFGNDQDSLWYTSYGDKGKILDIYNIKIEILKKMQNNNIHLDSIEPCIIRFVPDQSIQDDLSNSNWNIQNLNSHHESSYARVDDNLLPMGRSFLITDAEHERLSPVQQKNGMRVKLIDSLEAWESLASKGGNNESKNKAISDIRIVQPLIEHIKLSIDNSPLFVFASQYLTELKNGDQNRIIDLYDDPLFPFGDDMKNFIGIFKSIEQGPYYMNEILERNGLEYDNLSYSESRPEPLIITHTYITRTWNDVIYPLVKNDVGKITATLTQDLNNQGFQYPYRLNGGLKGGFETVEGLDQFTNIDNINYKPLDTLRGLYGDLAVPRKIYDCIYKDRYFAQFHDPSTIFKAAMNYFHKFNINQSSIFNNICYATLLINKAAFNESIKKIASIAEHIPDISNKLGGSYPLSDSFKVTKCILVNAIQNGINMFDQAQNHMPVELVLESPTEPGDTDTKLLIHQCLFDEAKFLKNVEKVDIASAITTILHFPSLNNNYYYSFMNGLFGTDEIRPLYSAFVVDGIRRLDAQCTYMHALFDWVKRTSFYNLEKDVDDFFSTQPNENPFDVI